MRHLAYAFSALAAGAVALPAHAHDMKLNTSCSVSTDYDVSIKPDGLRFTRDDGSPHRIVMHDGQLQVDGHPLAVDSADAARLRQYEARVRTLVPEVAGIAREGVGIGFDALTTVAATFSGSPAEQHRVVQQLTAQRERVMAEVDRGIAQGEWNDDRFEDLMDDHLGDAISGLVGTITSEAVKAALSGDQSRVQALQARADSLEKSIEQAVEPRARQLEARANALCPRLVELDQLQQQFEFRLPDGSPLNLMQLDRDDKVAQLDN